MRKERKGTESQREEDLKEPDIKGNQMKAYSQDLREKALRAIDQGKSRKEVIEFFGISLSTLKRYLRQRKQRGNTQAKKSPGRPPVKQTLLRETLLTQLEMYPDATLQEHCDLWAERSGMKVSIMTMSRAIASLKWTRKKTLEASERKEEERLLWREQVKDLDSEKFVFLDESGSSIALTRMYARAPKRKRARGSVPRNRRKNITLLASLSLSGMGESMLVEGAANTELFEISIERILLPTLEKGQIVIMDNLSIHKSQKTRQLIEAQGCQVLFLPAYSPDFSRQQKRLFPKSKPFCAKLVLEPTKRYRKPLLPLCSPSAARMRSAGFAIVAIFLLACREGSTFVGTAVACLKTWQSAWPSL